MKEFSSLQTRFISPQLYSDFVPHFLSTYFTFLSKHTFCSKSIFLCVTESIRVDEVYHVWLHCVCFNKHKVTNIFPIVDDNLYNSDGNDNDDSKTEKSDEPEVTNKWPELCRIS
jgi:hypothetical protein